MSVVILLVVLVVVFAIGGLWAASTYNGLVRLRNLVQEAWRQIDVELTRRHDLIPNLVETVRAYASHEREALDAVVAARSAAMSAPVTAGSAAATEGSLTSALSRLFAVAEAYPDLKANQNFLALQSELTETEDRVAAGRRFYNANVRELNTRVESFPSNLFANAFGIGRADYFELTDVAAREAPQVRFGAAPATVQPGALPPGPGGEYTVPGSMTSPLPSSAPSPHYEPPAPYGPGGGATP